MTMKISKIVVAFALLCGAPVYAGSWGYAVYQNQSYNYYLTVPSECTVGQQCEVSYGGTSTAINDGPLGDFEATPTSNYVDENGSAPAGTYAIYLSVSGGSSGFSAISVNW